MATKYGYTWEKMFNAIGALVEHPGPLQVRLVAAMTAAQTVFAHSRFEEAFPPDARAHARAVYERMTAREDEDAGSFAASARAMSDDDAAQVARWIRELYFRIHTASGANDWMSSKLEEPR